MSPMILRRDPEWYANHCCLCGRSLAGVATADPTPMEIRGQPVLVRACRWCNLLASMGDII